uniref:Uncharacterized protein n=1 Tax=Oryza sativa subsp. japonica TaxID=39947 RepID=Q67IY9_ORYSJ|nr:hypothetical protein [Oryza sativa Japonica Group]
MEEAALQCHVALSRGGSGPRCPPTRIYGDPSGRTTPHLMRGTPCVRQQDLTGPIIKTTCAWPPKSRDKTCI